MTTNSNKIPTEDNQVKSKSDHLPVKCTIEDNQDNLVSFMDAEHCQQIIKNFFNIK